MTDNTKGIIISIAAALATSNVFIFSKAALQEIHLAQFGVYWFGLGVLWNIIFIIVLKKFRKLKTLSRKSWLTLLMIAALEMIATTFFFLAINTVDNPTIVSFLTNINPLFIIFLGFLLLRERFNLVEGLGMLVTLLGAFVISYKGGDLKNIFIDGTQYVVASGVVYAFAAVAAKRNIKKIDPSFLALSRIIFLFFFGLAGLFYFDLDIEIPRSALINVSIGSVLGPFLAAWLGYLSLRYIEVSKVAMVRTIRSLFVLVGSYLFFGNIPASIQLVGGAITILGVVLITFGKIKFTKKTKNN